MPPKVLGLDPGFAKVGYAVVELLPTSERVIDIGLWETSKTDNKREVFACEDNFARAQELAAKVIQTCQAHNIKVLCAEAMSFPRHASVAAKMAMFWGVLACYCQANDLPMVQATPQRLKVAVCGSKSATKEEIQLALLERYGRTDPYFAGMLDSISPYKREHPADALAAVVTALASNLIRAVRHA